jgi:hypothetical protein
MVRRLKLSLKRIHAIEVTRIAVGNQKLIYVLVADRKFSYPHGKSAVAYIGTTKKGIERVASSAAHRAEDILSRFGVKKVTSRIVTCAPRQKVKTWLKLERAMLIAFRAEFGRVPAFNSHGKQMRETDEYDYFARNAVRKLI